MIRNLAIAVAACAICPLLAGCAERQAYYYSPSPYYDSPYPEYSYPPSPGYSPSTPEPYGDAPDPYTGNDANPYSYRGGPYRP
jgi:hypothetical protein